MSRINEARCSGHRHSSLLKPLPVLAALVLASGLAPAQASARQVQNDRASAVLGLFDITAIRTDTLERIFSQDV